MEESQIDYKALYEEQQGQVAQLQAQLDELSICRRCALPVNDKPLTVSEDIKKAYFKTLLTNKPFCKEYEILNGAVKIVFEMSRGRLLTAQRKALHNTANITMTTLNDVLLLSNLVSISSYDDDLEETTVIYERTADERAQALDDVQASIAELEETVDYVILACVRRVMDEFGLLVKTLIDNGLDENFYKGDGLVSP